MIEIPTNCPCCESVLQERNYLLYCENPNCSAKIEARLINFAKAMDIKGLGPSTVTKLGLDTVPEIYNLSLDSIINLLKSEKTSDKIYQEIQKSLNCPLSNVLQGFGVPLMGNTASKKLATLVDKVEDITFEICKKAGLGDKVSSNLMNFLESTYEEEKWDLIPFNFIKEEIPTNSGQVVCITGKLTSYKTKAEAEQVLIAKGYQVASSLTKAVNILVNESGVETQKTKVASERGVLIIQNLKIFLGE